MSSSAAVAAARAAGVSGTIRPSGSICLSQRSSTHSAAPFTSRALPGGEWGWGGWGGRARGEYEGGWCCRCGEEGRGKTTEGGNKHTPQMEGDKSAEQIKHLGAADPKPPDKHTAVSVKQAMLPLLDCITPCPLFPHTHTRTRVHLPEWHQSHLALRPPGPPARSWICGHDQTPGAPVAVLESSTRCMPGCTRAQQGRGCQYQACDSHMHTCMRAPCMLA